MQPGPDIVGRIGIALALITRDQYATGHHAGDTRQTNPLPYATHALILSKLRPWTLVL